MKVTIREFERGIVVRNGVAQRWLEPGRHWVWMFRSDVNVERINVNTGFAVLTKQIERVMPESAGEVLFVPSDQVALVSLDGRPYVVLRPGKYVLWNYFEQVTAVLYDADQLMSEMPERFWKLAPNDIFTVDSVAPYERDLVYVNGVLDSVLEPGRYLISKLDRDVKVFSVDLRETELQIVGQEVMTNDKVSIRVNVIVKYRIVDPVKSHETVTNLRDALYSETQMSARRFAASMTLEQMLERRNEGVDEMVERVQTRAGEWGVEVLSIDLKDVVLPGEMKVILNRVIEAQKEAEANVILRREETAATRSLANTAKMLEQNPTLMRLKELEAIKEISGSVGNITVVTNELGDIGLKL